MTDISCTYLIKKSYKDMSEKEKKIADHILANPEQAVSPSIETLSSLIGISESTLVRFVRKIGYKGYQSFRIALARETIRTDSLLYEVSLPSDADIEDVVFSSALATLEATRKQLDKKAVEKAASLIAEKGKLSLFGLGGSNIVATDAYHKLIRTGIACTFAHDYHMQLMQASQMKKGDIALVVSHTGSNMDTMALADEIMKREAILFVLTSHARSPLARAADIALVVWPATSTAVTESFSARLAQLVIIDILYVAITERLGDSGVKSLQDMRDVIATRRT